MLPILSHVLHLHIIPVDTARGIDKKDFLSEIEMMKKVCENHCPNVVAMLGCVTTKEPLCLVTEFITHGDLLTYLRTIRKMVRKLQSFQSYATVYIQVMCSGKKLVARDLYYQKVDNGDTLSEDNTFFMFTVIVW